MERSDTLFSLSNLFCQEDESCLNENEDRWVNFYPRPVSESEDEYIQTLIRRETSFESSCYVFTDVCSVMTDTWLKRVRSDAIKWILDTRASFGFHFRTAYLSLTYLDRFLSRRSIDNGKLWAIRLLSVACLSLAAKMEECKVPVLSQYRVNDYSFESNVIQRMELLVLNTLQWEMRAITPFAYLHCFITRFFGDSGPNDLASKAIEIILAITKEISLMDHRPSIIAAAAVLAASDCQLTRQTVEDKVGVIPSWGSSERGHVYSCYNLMRETEKGKHSKTPSLVISPNAWSICSSSTDVFRKSSISSAVSSKRRLAYNDCDQHLPSRKIRRS